MRGSTCVWLCCNRCMISKFRRIPRNQGFPSRILFQWNLRGYYKKECQSPRCGSNFSGNSCILIILIFIVYDPSLSMHWTRNRDTWIMKMVTCKWENGEHKWQTTKPHSLKMWGPPCEMYHLILGQHFLMLEHTLWTDWILDTCHTTTSTKMLSDHTQISYPDLIFPTILQGHMHI